MLAADRTRFDCHGPIAHHFGTTESVVVCRARQFGAEAGHDTGLLFHFPEGGLLVGFTRVDFALRECPVVILGTMDQDDLQLTGRRPSPNHTSSGANDFRVAVSQCSTYRAGSVGLAPGDAWPVRGPGPESAVGR